MTHQQNLLERHLPADAEAVTTLTLTDNGLALPATFTGATEFLHLVTPAVSGTYWISEPGLSAQSQLLWRRPVGSETTTRLDDRSLVLRNSDSSTCYTIADRRSPELAAQYPGYLGVRSLTADADLEAVVEGIGALAGLTQVQAARCDWLPTELRQSIQLGCTMLRHLQWQLAAVLPTTRPIAKCYHLSADGDAPCPGTLGRSLMYLKEVLWAASSTIEHRVPDITIGDHDITSRIQAAQKRWIRVHHQWHEFVEFSPMDGIDRSPCDVRPPSQPSIEHSTLAASADRHPPEETDD